MQTFLTLVNRLALFLTGGAWLCLCAAALTGVFFLVSPPEMPQQHGPVPVVLPVPAVLPVLRAAVPAHTQSTGKVAPFGPGFEEELLQRFGEEAGYAVRLLPVADAAAALRLVRLGLADVAAGFATGEQAHIVTGPPYFHARTILMPVTGAAGLEEKEALSRVKITANASAGATSQNTPPRTANSPFLNSTAHKKFLRDADGAVAALSAAETADPAPEDVWRMDARSWTLWAPFVTHVEKQTRLAALESTHESYHWAWRDGEALSAKLASFWNKLIQPGEGTLNMLEDRYFSYFHGRNKDNVLFLLMMVEKRLPRYSAIIAAAAEEAGIDPLLFAAVLMQESQLDEDCVSHTGVRGIMQLTKKTAAFLGVDRMDATQAIRGGARYLRMLWDDLEGAGLEEWDRWFCVLAAFNQGPLRLKGAMTLSARLNGGRRWSDLKTAYPLLARPRYAAMVGQSTCRGQEAVAFVDRVRWHYHMLRGLVALDRPEAQYIAPLLGSLRR